MSRSEHDAAVYMAVQAEHDKAEAARWEVMATQARKGMAVDAPKELMTKSDYKLLRKIYYGLAIFWIVTIGSGIYFSPQVFKFF